MLFPIPAQHTTSQQDAQVLKLAKEGLPLAFSKGEMTIPLSPEQLMVTHISIKRKVGAGSV